MPDDLFRGEWMPLYWQRLLKDIRDLTTEQIGAYVLLLGYQWEEGGIPRDIARLAVIARISPAKMRSAMTAFGHRFVTHTTQASMLVNPFMERVRDEQRAKFEKWSQAGKKGAAARHGSSDVTGNRSSNRSNVATADDSISATPDIENREHHLATLGDAAGAREAESDLADQADGLSAYLLDAAIENGMQLEHRRLDLGKWRFENREAALRLVRCYGLEPCKVRALAYVVAVKTGKIASRIVSVATLEKVWNYRELTDVVKSAADAGPSFDEMMGVA